MRFREEVKEQEGGLLQEDPYSSAQEAAPQEYGARPQQGPDCIILHNPYKITAEIAPAGQ